MKITINIREDDAAMTDDREHELRRILGKAVEEIATDCVEFNVLHGIHDLNGNSIGGFIVEAD